MRKSLLKKLIESVQAIAPITLLVVVLALALTDASANLIASFLIGAVLLILGMALFALGADIAMMPMGNSVGAFLAKTKKSKFWIVALVCLVIGFVITIAEPDLTVLAQQLSKTGTNYAILFSVAGGVGVFLVVSFIRTFFKVKLKYLLIGFYGLVFSLAIALYFVNPDFLSISFDSGGVTTGPITVPFLMALGFGVASVRGSSSDDDSFGMVALCSVGPIIAIMVLGLTGAAPIQPPDYSSIHKIDTFTDVLASFGDGLLHSVSEVALSLAPIIAVFFFFNIVFLKLPKGQIIKIIVGIAYTFVGLSIFLAGVNTGFLPMGVFLGRSLASLSYNWIMIPIGMVCGALIVLAEPAIHVLNKQVEEITGGAISKRAMLLFLSVGVAIAIGLSMLRILTGLSIWWFVTPVYIISLIMSFFVPAIFTGIAFDSGGVASGPMTATFMLPLAIGACEVIGGGNPEKIFMDGFGLVAFVAMTPLIAIQILGLVFQFKKRRLSRKERTTVHATDIDILAQGENDDTIDTDDTIDFMVDNTSHMFGEDELSEIVSLEEAEAETGGADESAGNGVDNSVDKTDVADVEKNNNVDEVSKSDTDNAVKNNNNSKKE